MALMDPLALYTHGEFRSRTSAQPELLLYTHGEFPRAGDQQRGGAPAPSSATTIGGRSSRRPYRDPYEIDMDELAAALLLLDD